MKHLFLTSHAAAFDLPFKQGAGELSQKFQEMLPEFTVPQLQAPTLPGLTSLTGLAETPSPTPPTPPSLRESFALPDVPFQSKVVDWWHGKASADPPPPTTAPKPSPVPVEPRHDPRLVPSMVYDMECLPGSAFHTCVQDCNHAADQGGALTPRGGTYSETESFKGCIKNCTDALLNSPGPGCMTEDGRLISRDPAGLPAPMSPGRIQVKAWAYRIRHALAVPLGGWVWTMIYPIFSLLLGAVLFYALVYQKSHELIYILLNGLPENSQSPCQGEKDWWMKAHEAHGQTLEFLIMTEEQWNVIAAALTDALYHILRAGKMATEQLRSASSSNSEASYVQSYGQNDVMDKLRAYELHSY